MKVARKISYGIVVMLMCALVAVWRWSRQPVVSKPLDTVTQVQAQSVKAPSALESPYFIASIEGSLSIRTNQESPTAQLLQQIVALNARNANSDQMAITIGMLPDGGIEELSAVKYRSGRPQDYTRISIAGMPTDAVVFRSVGSQYEFSVFWPKSTLFASIVSSGTINRQQELNNQMMITINSWQWR